MRAVWTALARHDRTVIFDLIAQDDLEAAERLDERFAQAADRLCAFPVRAVAGSVQGTRELVVHKHYRLIYEIEGNTVLILALVHTSRCWPPPADRSR
ncbi:type II toxin-antitoxin system RelE/ParE family toxin [Cupriavidus necator]|uniref:type II toxin-antitoxin system RelE/ParE family toxin n=1 Tax=Cupriavidus necator TaxID=106590 RepID=UPI0005B4BB2C|nr:type II toxin-antitoxin system RelE/ParE family toxin [Cupriavidus necator]